MLRVTGQAYSTKLFKNCAFRSKKNNMKYSQPCNNGSTSYRHFFNTINPIVMKENNKHCSKKT